MYGKIPLADYVKLVEQENKKGTFDKQTLREDWEIYWDKNANLHIGYSCACESCGFSMSIDEIKPMEGGAS